MQNISHYKNKLIFGDITIYPQYICGCHNYYYILDDIGNIYNVIHGKIRIVYDTREKNEHIIKIVMARYCLFGLGKNGNVYAYCNKSCEYKLVKIINKFHVIMENIVDIFASELNIAIAMINNQDEIIFDGLNSCCRFDVINNFKIIYRPITKICFIHSSIIIVDNNGDLYIDDYTQPKFSNIKLLSSHENYFIFVDTNNIIYYYNDVDETIKTINMSENIISICNIMNDYYFTTNENLYYFTTCNHENNTNDLLLIMKQQNHHEYFLPVKNKIATKTARIYKE